MAGETALWCMPHANELVVGYDKASVLGTAVGHVFFLKAVHRADSG
jgi:hypothetical protein